MNGTARDLRVIQIAHSSAGRLRLRLPWLHADRDMATALADLLAARRGVIEVAVRPRTGSVLCVFDQRGVDARNLIAAVRRATRVAVVLPPGAPVRAPAGRGRPAASSVRHALVDAFRGLDEDVYRATSGRVDLGTLAGLGLLVAGAAEVGMTRQLPVPPWFSLAWWAFRTFTMSEPPPPAQLPPPDYLAARRARRRIPPGGTPAPGTIPSGP
jgi:hypothetical protein